MRSRVGLSPVTVLGTTLLFTSVLLQAQARTNLNAPMGTASVTVHVQEAGGGPLNTPAQVKLFTQESPLGTVQVTGVGGVANFGGIAPGTYVVQLIAAGYKPAREEVMVVGDASNSQVFLTMYREGSAAEEQKKQSHSGPPLVVGRSRKELDLAIAALRADKSAEAAQHMEYALKHASGSPDVQYVAAMVALGTSDAKGARQHLDAAVKAYPGHFGAQTALGVLLLQQGQAAEAIPPLEKAVSLDPTSL